MPRRLLALGDVLPLTCTRSGTCCHGKEIRITPWELACLARARGESAAAFRERDTVDAGTRLRVTGPPGWRGLPSCSQYDPARGCVAHVGRPLACRLFPLGRELAGGKERIFHDGAALPCLDGCPEVAALPHLTVADYLVQQGVAAPAAVRDAYLEIALDLADAALGLVHDSGLAAGSDRRWLAAWRQARDGGPAAWLMLLGPDWHGVLTTPACTAPVADGLAWTHEHAALISAHAGQPASELALVVRLFAAACLLVQGVGGEVPEISGRWIAQVA